MAASNSLVPYMDHVVTFISSIMLINIVVASKQVNTITQYSEPPQ